MTRPLALVTGASTGIGAAFARLLAAEGYDLLLAADEPAVHDVAKELDGTGRRAEACVVDLADPQAVHRLHDMAHGFGQSVDVAVLNAGIGVWGRFDEVDLDTQLRVVDLNVRSTVHLAVLLARDMAAAGRGRMLMVASIAGKAPGPGHAAYAASKAFVHSYAEAARHDLRGTGVSVTSLLPGPTATSFFRRNDMEEARVAQGPQASAETVARQGYEAMMRGRDMVVGGRLFHRVQTMFSGFVPDRLGAAIASRETERVGPPQE
ncbi:SDR family NAD(P)-dependent oxidoreductase [Nocardioides sp.]|uniref:SDR family NAD(P)-dependent oxidoreductase n=1 Tax=Nocardioides sp. TaxID=35761 RepID=UPI002ED4B6A1